MEREQVRAVAVVCGAVVAVAPAAPAAAAPATAAAAVAIPTAATAAAAAASAPQLNHNATPRQRQRQLIREPRAFPKLTINPEVKDIDGFCFDDFSIEGYEPHKRIKMEMAV